VSKYASKKFWVDAADRAVATFAQGALAAIGAEVTGLANLDIVAVLSVGGLAALTSLLTSVALRPGPAPEWDDEPGSDDLRGERD
jgi:hypothetical protein